MVTDAIMVRSFGMSDRRWPVIDEGLDSFNLSIHCRLSKLVANAKCKGTNQD